MPPFLWLDLLGAVCCAMYVNATASQAWGRGRHLQLCCLFASCTMHVSLMAGPHIQRMTPIQGGEWGWDGVFEVVRRGAYL
jgi:hypothetical protein